MFELITIMLFVHVEVDVDAKIYSLQINIFLSNFQSFYQFFLLTYIFSNKNHYTQIFSEQQFNTLKFVLITF